MFSNIHISIKNLLTYTFNPIACNDLGQMRITGPNDLVILQTLQLQLADLQVVASQKANATDFEQLLCLYNNVVI